MMRLQHASIADQDQLAGSRITKNLADALQPFSAVTLKAVRQFGQLPSALDGNRLLRCIQLLEQIRLGNQRRNQSAGKHQHDIDHVG